MVGVAAITMVTWGWIDWFGRRKSDIVSFLLVVFNLRYLLVIEIPIVGESTPLFFLLESKFVVKSNNMLDEACKNPQTNP